MPIGGIISGIGSVIGAKMGAKQSQKNLTQQLTHNRQMAERQYANDISQRDYMNQYNAPVAQMQRFKEAGLNPHLIYGQGSPGQQTQLPKYSEQAPDFSKQQSVGAQTASAIGGTIGNYLEIRKKQNEIVSQQQGIEAQGNQLDIQRDPGWLKSQIIGARLKEWDAQKSMFQTYSAQEGERQLRQKGVVNQELLQLQVKQAELSNLNSNARLTNADLKNAYQRMSNLVYKNSTAKGRTLNENAMISGWKDIMNGTTTDQSQQVIYAMGAQASQILADVGRLSMLGKAGKFLTKPGTPKGNITSRKVNYDAKGKRIGSSINRTHRRD